MATKPDARSGFRLAASPWPCAEHDAQHTSRTRAVVPASAPVLRWSSQKANEPEPAIAPDGNLYMSGFDSRTLAIDGNTGRVNWEVPAESAWVPAVLVNGNIVISSAEPVLIDQQAAVTMTDSSGRRLWHVRLGKPVFKPEEGLGVSSPTIGAYGTIYVAVDGQGLFALDPVDGRVLWTFSAANQLGQPTLGQDGTIYELEGFAVLTALKPDGSVRWRAKTEAWAGTPLAVGPDGTVYVQEPDTLRAVAPDGRDRWRLKLTVQGALGIGRDGTVYAPTPGLQLSAVSPAGRVLWVVKHGSHAALVDGVGRIVIQDGGTLYAFKPDGSQLWQAEVGEGTGAMPVVGTGGTIYICNDAGPGSVNAWGGAPK